MPEHEVFLRDTLLPIFKRDLSEIIGQEATIYIEESDPQTINFEYPHIFTTESILQAIRLEIGALAAWTPAREKSVTPYTARMLSQSLRPSNKYDPYSCSRANLLGKGYDSSSRGKPS